MARVLVESYMARYPLAGMMSWTLQYLVGLHRLGHDVFFVERATHPWACFDPRTGTADGGCAHGIAALGAVLGSVGLGSRWVFVDSDGTHHGRSSARVDELFRTADVFMVMTFEECWHELAAEVPCRVVLDGDPVFRQIANREADARGEPRPQYDVCFTAALNVNGRDARVPDDGEVWQPLVHPVATDLFPCTPPPVHGAMTSVLNWRSYDAVVHDGEQYGQKDVELERMLDLPSLVAAPLELAIAGDAPRDRLRAAGWRVREGHEVTGTFPSFQAFVNDSLGELSVCKAAYVATRSGWFSDRSSAYLASGRPVVLQDTAFSAHLPCGEGLFAFTTPDEARDAVDRIVAEPERQGRAARRFAEEHLEAVQVLDGVMQALGA